MSFYDPHSGTQIRALRTDPTGRHNPIVLDDVPQTPFWFVVLGTVALLGAASLVVMVLS